MTKNIFYYLLLLLVPFLLYSCDSSPIISKKLENFTLAEGQHYNLFKLKGKVKSAIILTYSANDSLIFQEQFKFNKLGQTIEHISHNDTKIQYTYDESGNHTEKIRWKNEHKFIEYKYLDSFDTDGKIIKRFNLNDQGQKTLLTSYSYLKNGLLKSRKHYWAENEKWIDEYFYHKNDQLQKKISSNYDSSGSLIRSFTDTYNNRGQFLSKISSYQYSYNEKELFVYDSLFHLVTHTVSTSDDSSYLKESIVQYDSNHIKIDSIFNFYENKTSVTPSNTAHFRFNDKAQIETFIYKDQDTITHVISYFYDKKEGFLKEKNSVYTTGFTKYFYDRNEIKIMQKKYIHGKDIKNTEKILIDYDSNLNMIKAYSYINDSLELYHERILEYY